MSFLARRCVGAMVAMVLIVGGGARAAELFVGGEAGDYSNLAAAITAASEGDTITIRGGYTTAGATINKPNLTIRSQFYSDINANNPDDLTQLNPARSDANESVVTSPVTLRTQSAGNPDGTRILGLFFQISSGSGSAVNFNPTGGRTVTNVLVRNNRFRATTTGINAWVGAGGSVHSGSYGWAEGILVENNRMGDLFLANGSAMFPTGKDWTIKGNYINHDADGLRSGQPGYDPLNTVYENGRRGFNINGVASNPTENIVVVGNVFDGFGGVAGNSWAVQPNNHVSNIVIADNTFNGSARDIVTYQTGANQLIAGNESSNNRSISIDYQLGYVSNMVVRQNAIEIDVTSDRGFYGIRVLAHTSTTGQGMLIENNQISLTGAAGSNANARAGIILGATVADLDRFDLFGPLTIRNNVLQDTGLTGRERVGILYTAAGGRVDGGMTLYATNNLFSGLDYGAYVSADLTATNSGALPSGDLALLANNNFLDNVTGVHGGTGEAVEITGSYFSGNTTDTNGNVLGLPGVSPHSVTGRSPEYVTFRGDFNLDNVVDEADRQVWSNQHGTFGPAATYFRGDATLDQAVSAADLLVWKRHSGLEINASALPPAPLVPPGEPVVLYNPGTGKLSIRGAGSEAWAFVFPDGSVNLHVSEHTEGNLGASWQYASFAPASDTHWFEYVDAMAGDAPVPAVLTEVATLQTRLTEDAFGPVTYYVGSNAFQTTVRVRPSSSLFVVQ